MHLVNESFLDYSDPYFYRHYVEPRPPSALVGIHHRRIHLDIYSPFCWYYHCYPYPRRRILYDPHACESAASLNLTERDNDPNVYIYSTGVGSATEINIIRSVSLGSIFGSG